MQPDEYRRMFALEDWYWWFVARRRAALRFARDWQPAPRGGKSLRVLDAGCGTGAMLDLLARTPGYETVGVDRSAAALSFTASRGHDRLAGGDLDALPFRDGYFDVILALDVIEHLDEDGPAVCELARVLRPGGVLVTTVPAYQFLWGPHDEALHHRRRYGGRQFRDLLEQGGLRVKWLTFLLMLLFPPAALARVLAKGRPGRGSALLPAAPRLVNRLLVGLQALETEIARVAPLPFGLSILVVAVRPEPERVGSPALEEAVASPCPA